MLPSMHLIYPVRLAVRSVDSVEALRVLDSPFENHSEDLTGLSGDDITGRP